MKRFKILFALILTLSVGQQVFGQQTIYVGILRESFNYFALAQRNSNWCWASSLQMIFNYYGVNISTLAKPWNH